MNSQDRELLELAAKAAGVAGVFVEVHGPDIGQDAAGIGRPGARYGDRLWNPIIDDGAALRLGVKLSLGIEYEGSAVGVTYFDQSIGANGSVCLVEESLIGDAQAAVRLAIVRAAAEIGKTK